MLSKISYFYMLSKISYLSKNVHLNNKAFFFIFTNKTNFQDCHLIGFTF